MIDNITNAEPNPYTKTSNRYSNTSGSSLKLQSVFAEVFARLEIAVLTQQANGTFLALGQVPNWFSAFFASPIDNAASLHVEETFAFLSNFLDTAQQHWQDQRPGVLESELWVECNLQGTEVPLAASAIYLEPFNLLLLQHAQTAYEQQMLCLQRGRETTLAAIQERKQNAEQLQRSTFYDWSTGLPNQMFLKVQLMQALERLKHEDSETFILGMLDIVDFKAVNMRYGPGVGDLILMQVIERIKQHLASEDLLARLGDDSFVIIPWSLGQQDAVEPLMTQLLADLKAPYRLEGNEITLNFTLGMAQGTAFQDQPEEVLNRANIAMDYARRQGTQHYAMYDATMHLQAMRQSDLERDLPQSIQHQQLLAYYEPIVSLQQGDITGFEALVRWHHPMYGLLSPLEFIPLAEETGFVVSLGQWMLDQACHQVNQWNAGFNRSLAIQVNLSARQLTQPNLLSIIQTILHQTPVPPQALKLEITESMVHQNLDLVVAQLQQIKAFGIHICMDDFGTGYSSLNYLHRLPIDTLKIDRSLTQATTPGSAEILRATVNLAHNLGLDVIAEGVETVQQLKRIQSLGCDYVQGYLFAKPAPPSLAQQLLRHPPTALQSTQRPASRGHSV